MNCIHCGRPVGFGENRAGTMQQVHDNGLRHCLPYESGAPYGLQAEVADA